MDKHRRLADTQTNHTALTKRDFPNSRFTYYYVEVGEVACGGWYKDGDFVRAFHFHDGQSTDLSDCRLWL